jgi:hypothetical protein
MMYEYIETNQSAVSYRATVRERIFVWKILTLHTIFTFFLFISLSSLNLKYFSLFVLSYLLPQYNTCMHVIAINFTIYSQHDTINHKSFLPFFDEVMRAHEIKFIGHDIFCT